MVSVLFLHPLQLWWFLVGHLDFLCCDPGRGHSLVRVACHHSILVPNVPFCHIWNNGNHMPGSLLCWLGAVMCSWDSPWRVQMVCDHGCCGWYRPSAFCPGRLCPQAWSCGRLVSRHVGWQGASQQCQSAHWRVS